MCSSAMGSRPLTVEEKIKQIDNEIRFAEAALEDAKGLPELIAWLERQRLELTGEAAQ